MIVKGLTKEELREYLHTLNLPGYRADQIYSWVYQKQARTWEEMTNLPQDIRQKFKAQDVSLGCLEAVAQTEATDGTIKYLFELPDGQRVESVYLPEPDRRTVCLSTQAGCGMGCLFCATGQSGLIRNLTVAEIVDQVLSISRTGGGRIDNLVIMGQGEPLVNYDAVLKAIRIFNDPEGLGIGARHITVSTCGFVPGIYKLSDEPLQVNLAISLHSADDELRNFLMPINKKYSLKELWESCRIYSSKTGRRITFEYVMIDGVNDRDSDLEKLIKAMTGILARIPCHVNLIPLNPIPNLKFKSSNAWRLKEFSNRLNQAHIETTIRKERGRSLAAACGQLAARAPEGKGGDD
ncbi:MAG TPA: 23S rRNA (adenine(2503)-C(2))-methyltransferase RlmN [Bacillota bacterium]|nr:23S rRNA (adenine(2503)-C(2))-methyltransferase RlmN [Bacillota bacterium]